MPEQREVVLLIFVVCGEDGILLFVFRVQEQILVELLVLSPERFHLLAVEELLAGKI